MLTKILRSSCSTRRKKKAASHPRWDLVFPVLPVNQTLPLPPRTLTLWTFLNELRRFRPDSRVTHFFDSSLKNYFRDRQWCRRYGALLAWYVTKCCVCHDICQILFLDVWWPMGSAFQPWQTHRLLLWGFFCRDWADRADREHKSTRLCGENFIVSFKKYNRVSWNDWDF